MPGNMIQNTFICHDMNKKEKLAEVIFAPDVGLTGKISKII